MEAEQKAPVRFMIKREDLEKHGFSTKCPGCKAILRGTARQGHSEQCRARLTEAMKGEEKVKKNDERINEFVEKRLEAQDAKRRKMAEENPPEATAESAARPRGGGEASSSSGVHPRRRHRAAEDGDPEQGREPKRRKEEDVDEEDMQIDVAELDVNLEGQPFDFNEPEGPPEIAEEELQRARTEEVSFMKMLGVWEPSSLEECLQMTGRPPVSTRWVDVDKGREGRVEIRSRLVARDFKVKGDKREVDTFAAMPPMEAKRVLFRMAMLDGAVGGDAAKGGVKLMFIDIKKAHLNGKLVEDEYAYVQLPLEAGGGVARLRRWLYGMRQAASAWEEEYAKRLEEIGFVRGRSATTVFWHPESGVRMVVWGDDFTILGRQEDLRNVAKSLAEWYEVKIRAVMGPDVSDDHEVRILNRTLKWKNNCIQYEGDERHAKTVIAGMGLQGDSKGLDAATVKEDDGTDDTEELSEAGSKRYRSLAAVVNFLSLDRPDLQYAASVLGRSMSRPTVKAEARLKRVARYLLAHPRFVHTYCRGVASEVLELVAWSDSDWAGCRASRKSMSGGILAIGGGIVKSWSNRQASIALSSGEAEFYAAGKAATEALGAKSLLRDLGWKTRLTLNIDAEAARAIASRQGVGKIRHLEVHFLWLQDVVRSGIICLSKIWGKTNPADALTKPMGVRETSELLERVGYSEVA